MGLQLQDKRYEDIRLVFDPIPHKYNDTLGRDYVSATTILGQYKPKFDNRYWLKKKAKELNITTKELEKQWDAIRDEACARGNVTHDALEASIRKLSMFSDAVQFREEGDNSMITVADLPRMHDVIKPLDIDEFIEATDNKYPEIYKVFRYYSNLGYKIYAELGAFLIDHLLSGMIDVLMIRDDSFIIGDWKTNRGGLEFTAGYYKKDKTVFPNQETDVRVTTNKKLNPPLTNLPECNGSIYNLQLSLYAKMVEKILGIPCKGLWLCHIDSDFVLNEYGRPKRFNDGFRVKENPVEKCTIHLMDYLSNEIDLILQDRTRIIAANATTAKINF